MIRGRFITISYEIKRQFNLEFSECALLGHLTNLTSFGHNWYETAEYMPRTGKRSKGRFLFQLAQLIDEGFTVGGVSKLLKRLTAKQLIEIREDSLAVNVTKTYLEAWAAVNRYDDGVTVKKSSRAKEQPKEKEKEYFERLFTKIEFCEIIKAQNTEADTEFYFAQITEHYRGDKMTKEQGRAKIQSWLKRERKIVTKENKEGRGATQVNIEEITKEYLRYKMLVLEPHENTQFSQYKENVKSVLGYGKQIEIKINANENEKKFFDFIKKMTSTAGATKVFFDKKMAKYTAGTATMSDQEAADKIQKNLEQLAANLKQ
jgi:hypothetical protein